MLAEGSTNTIKKIIWYQKLKDCGTNKMIEKSKVNTDIFNINCFINYL
jgi:hypothetical protein